MKHFFLFLLCFYSFSAFSQDFQHIRERLTELGSYQSLIKKENKSWDFDSFSKKINVETGAYLRKNPRPNTTDIKTELLQLAFYLKRNDLKENELDQVKKAMYRSLSWWLTDKPQFRWTDSAIDQPRYVGTVLLLLANHIYQDEKNPKYSTWITRIKEKSADYLRFTWNFGKEDNRFLNLGEDLHSDVQRMGNVGYRLYSMTAIASVLEDEDLMSSIDEIVKNQFKIEINSPNNFPIALMPDFSFHQHNYGGSQIYNLGYGLDWFNDFVTYSYFVKDGRWKFSEQELLILVDFLERGIYPFFLEDNLLVQQVLGRHNQVQYNWIKFPESRAKVLRSYFDEEQGARKRIDAILQDLTFSEKLGVKAYYSSDFLLADFPKYTASVRMVSTRTSGQETGDNGQLNGMENFFSSDGSFYFYRQGLDQVKGAWEWRQVPGTTTGQIEYPLPFVPYGKGYRGLSSYGGVMESEKGGIIAGNLRRNFSSYSIEVVKSYFLMEDFVLFFGNSLKYPGKEKVVTNVTQERWKEGAFLLENDIELPISMGMIRKKSSDSPVGFWIDSNGYLIFPVGEKQLSYELLARDTKTRWKELDSRNSQDESIVPLIQINIAQQDDGEVISDSYLYIQIPKIEKEAFVKIYNQGNVNLNQLNLHQLEFSSNHISFVHSNEGWFLNFRNAGVSSFQIKEQPFNITGLVGGKISLDEEELKISLSQFEKSANKGRDFQINLGNLSFDEIKVFPKLKSNPVLNNNSNDNQLNGNTAPQNSLDFGSTFSIHLINKK